MYLSWYSKILEIPEGGAPKTSWNGNPGGRGVQIKTFSVGAMDIFWDHTMNNSLLKENGVVGIQLLPRKGIQQPKLEITISLQKK